MMDKIQKLYNSIRNLNVEYLIYQNRRITESAREYLPQIQEFASFFLEGNQFGIEEELYQGLSRNLLNILQDIVEAMGQEDVVLLNDALAYGLMDYLEMFIDTEQEEESNDAV